MKPHELLGQLSVLHQMTDHLLTSVPEADCYRRFHPAIPPLAWLLGRSTYLETYWLREVVQRDADLTARVRPLFGAGIAADDALMQQLPPREHLLNWALELQDQNLTLLANPRLLPPHPLVEAQRLLPLIVQQEALLCEQMLAQLAERQRHEAMPYSVAAPLRAQPPSEDHADVHQGHYRIGAKEDPAALDNELPTQIVELHAFRIDRHPVSNGAYLGFIQAGGYDHRDLWSDTGWQWREQHQATQPHHWRRDILGNWYGIGLNGPFDLIGDDAVSGISLYEAEAYAAWVGSLGGRLAGAVVQHEYQWEVAARSQAISDFGRVWEWCANPFHRYTGYVAPDDPEAGSGGFDTDHTLRGGCLHSQRIQRRSSYRHHLAPDLRYHFSGTRLVFPPSQMPWHKDHEHDH